MLYMLYIHMLYIYIYIYIMIYIMSMSKILRSRNVICVESAPVVVGFHKSINLS